MTQVPKDEVAIEDTKTTPLPIRSKKKPFWDGEWNVWFIFGAVISLWFTIGRGIPYFASSRLTWISGFHLIAALLSSWGCLWNLFHPPSHGKEYRRAHVIIGRIVVMCSIILFIPGAYLAFTGGSIGFAIGVTIGGVMQLVSAFMGVLMIRRGKTLRNIRHHQFWMSFVFFGGCLTPAFIRIPSMMHVTNPDSWAAWAWIFPLIMGVMYNIAVFYKSKI